MSVNTCMSVCLCLHVSVYRRYCKLCIVSAFKHTGQHVTSDHALLCVCVFQSHTSSFMQRGWPAILSGSTPRALEYAGCFCYPTARSAFLALSYNGAPVDTGLRSGLSHHCRLTSCSRESQVSQCTIDGKRASLKDKDITKDLSNHRSKGECFHGCL